MALAIKKTSSWWYARFRRKGLADTYVNTGVKIEGKRPDSISATGPDVDPAFVRSRDKAIEAHDRIERELTEGQNVAALMEKLIDLKRGPKVEFVKLADLPAKWKELGRKRKVTKSYEESCVSALHRFVSFVQDNNRGVDELIQVNEGHLKAYMNEQDRRGVTPRTWNFTYTLLKGAIGKLEPNAPCMRYFAQTPKRDNETVSKEALTDEQLRAVLDAAAEDDLIYPVVLTAVYTAMRRGDCCLLEWASVDLKEGFICLEQHKTRTVVEIPILPTLRAELVKHKGNESTYCFPAVADQYKRNPKVITERVYKILESAGIEEHRKDRTQGIRRANLRGFHSFRTTGATRLLSAGVPPETVIQITGHKSIRVLLENYDKRTRNDRRRKITEAMSSLDGNAPAAMQSHIIDLKNIVMEMSPRRLREKALRLIEDYFE